MLNEERVKHMVKLAFYETKNGKEELKASSFYQKDYVTFNMLWSVIWMTIAYVIFVALLGVAFMSVIIEGITIGRIVILVVAIVAIYIALLITYIVISKKFYKKKHARAYYHVKKFRSDLTELKAMYEREDIDGEAI